MLVRGSLAALCLVVGVSPAAAQSTKAFVGARIIPIDGPAVDDGVLLIRDKRIAAVGSKDEVPIPAGAAEIYVAGRTIMPGLICTHSHIGGGGAADGSDPIQPGVRISDSINVLDSGFKRAVAGGL